MKRRVFALILLLATSALAEDKVLLKPDEKLPRRLDVAPDCSPNGVKARENAVEALRRELQSQPQKLPEVRAEVMFRLAQIWDEIGRCQRQAEDAAAQAGDG